jgi:hypothetical protein
VRSIIRRWITEWDVRRYYSPDTEIVIVEDEAIKSTPTEELPELEEDEE